MPLVTDNEIVQAVRVCRMTERQELMEINFIWEHADELYTIEPEPGFLQVFSLYKPDTAQKIIGAIHSARCQYIPEYAALWN